MPVVCLVFCFLRGRCRYCPQG
ncbi:hypothetical protein [Bradyrhizobium sp. USDA 3364]